jgi:alanine dehydrogenase
VDVAVDQGGCVETIRPTTHAEPVYRVHDVLHYGVPNIPAAVPRTATFALCNVTIYYIRRIADMGLDDALGATPALQHGLNTRDGKITHYAVAEAFAAAR